MKTTKRKASTSAEQLQYQKKLFDVVRAERDEMKKTIKRLNQIISEVNAGSHEVVAENRSLLAERTRLESEISRLVLDNEVQERKLKAQAEQVRVLLDRLDAADASTSKPQQIDPLDGTAVLRDVLKRVGIDAAIDFCSEMAGAASEPALWKERGQLLSLSRKHGAAAPVTPAAPTGSGDQEPKLDESERRLVRNRELAKAVQKFRDRNNYNISISDTKNIINRYCIAIGAPLWDDSQLDVTFIQLNDAEKELADDPAKWVRAIKALRERNKLGLKAAKDVVDFYTGKLAVDPQPFTNEDAPTQEGQVP